MFILGLRLKTTKYDNDVINKRFGITGHVHNTIAKHALSLLEVDRDGLDGNDRKILNMLIRQYNGGPVGVEALAASLGEDPGTLEDVYEPYLIQNGFINRTPRGRVAASKAYISLGLEEPVEA